MDLEHLAREDMPSRKVYTSRFLLSFAGTDSCRKPPLNIDLREINAEVSVEEAIPEWRRRASTPSPTGKHGQRRQNRLSHSLSDSFRSQGKVEDVSTFPTKNRVNKKQGGSSVKLETTRRQLQGSNCPGQDYIEKDISVKVSPVCTSDSENSDLSISSPDQKIDLGTLFGLEKRRVLPMPAAPTLEEIENKMKVTGFLTCQDVEKSILSPPKELVSTPTSNSSSLSHGRDKWLDGAAAADKAASKHILSLLQGNQSTEGVSGNETLVRELSVANLVEALKRQENEMVNRDSLSSNYVKSRFDTTDSVRTTVKPSSDNLVRDGHISPAATTLWQNMPLLQHHQEQKQQQRHWQHGIKHPPINQLRHAPPLPMAYSTPPNTFLQTRPVAVGMAETPLVPQALQALQRLVDHQLHILNSIPGEVTPGMLHQRLSRSVLGYPATGTHVLLGTTCAPAYGFGV